MIGAAILIAISIAGFGLMSPVSRCTCTAVDSNVTTRWGGNEFIVLKQAHAVKALIGTVGIPLSELSDDVLVEVFDQPDYLICEWLNKNPNNCTTTPPENQRRIAACTTGKDGRFCFENLPAGKYELRASKGQSWNPTHIYVVVAPSGTKKSIEVPMHVGT